MKVSNYLMEGMTVKSLQKHPSLIPLWVVLGFGCGLATFYTLRLATRNPDVAWNKSSNPYPWQRFQPTTQYKFYSIGREYTKLEQDPEKPSL